jgi:hypothetical protein
MMTRKRFFTTTVAAIAAVTGARPARAQFTENEVRNGATITATGDVSLDQAASGEQVVDINGSPVDLGQDGVYRTSTGQVVVNDGRIVATGDVRVSQSASGDQTVTALYDGVPASQCRLGAVIADPDGILFYQKQDCCWYRVPCCAETRQCKGDRCS